MPSPKKPTFIEEPLQSSAAPSQKIKKEPRGRRRKETAHALKAIYENAEGLPDFTKLERKKRSPRSILLGLCLFFAVLAGAAWAGFFIFKPYRTAESGSLTLGINGSNTVRAAEVQRYEFSYQNTERAPLAALELRLVIPKEFSIISLTPAPTSEPMIWTLGVQDGNASGSIVVEGYFLGPAEGKTAFQSIATYRPANFNSDFQSITTFDITLAGSMLEGIVTGPPEAAPGEKQIYEYSLKNTSTIALEKIEVQLTAPDTFLAIESEPSLNQEKNQRWIIPNLEPNTETNIIVRGSFTTSARDRTAVGFRVGIRQNDQFLIHRTDTVETDVLAGDLMLTMVANGSTKDLSAGFGDDLRISLAYRNAGTSTLLNVSLAISLAEDPDGLIDWKSLNMTDPGRVSAGVIHWSSKEIPSLASIGPGTEGTVDVTLPLVRRPSTKEGADEIRLGGSALISGIERRAVAHQVQTTPIIVRLASDAALTAEARYFDEDGVPLGSGSLPPKVGETTKIRIIWTITNTRHDLEQIKISTTVPARVAWTGKTTSDQSIILWDETARTVRWTIDRLPKNTTTVQGSFELNITPESSEVGKFVTLTRDSAFEARDTKTGILISKTLPILTTEMPTDEGAKGKGIVVE